MLDQELPLSLSECSLEKNNSEKEFLDREGECSDVFTEIKKKIIGKDANDNEIGAEEPDIECIIKKAQELMQESGGVFKSLHANGSGRALAKGNKCVEKAAGNAAAAQINKTDYSFKLRLNKPLKFNKRPHSANSALLQIKNVENLDKPTSAAAARRALQARYNELQNVTMDKEERLKSLELQYARLLQVSRQTRSGYDKLTTENGVLESKFKETIDSARRTKEEFNSLIAQNKRFKENEERLMIEVENLKLQKNVLETQTMKDRTTVQDLQRQCRQMEMALRRKHPDSVSALIVAAKHQTLEDPEKKLLEKRTEDLENTLKSQEYKFNNIIAVLHKQFEALKEKYESHIGEIEFEASNLRGVIAEMDCRPRIKTGTDIGLQVKINDSDIPTSTKQTQTLNRPGSRLICDSDNLMSGTSMVPKKIYSALKEDSHLLATIKGLQKELLVKNREILKLKRDINQLHLHVNKLHREKDVLSKINSADKFPSRLNVKSTDDLCWETNNSELFQLRSQKLKWETEVESLSQSVRMLEAELKKSHKQRIQDLHTLQVSHEEELIQSSMEMIPLQENIKCLSSTIVNLQTYVKTLEDELSIGQMEKDCLNKQFSQRSLSNVRPCHSQNVKKVNVKKSDVDVHHLQLKIFELEQKHEARELRLNKLGSILNKLTTSTTSRGITQN